MEHPFAIGNMKKLICITVELVQIPLLKCFHIKRSTRLMDCKSSRARTCTCSSGDLQQEWL